MAEVVLSHVLKRFRSAGDGRQAEFTLGPIDLCFGEGELSVLAGPSGCGKTTLLRLIAGLETPSSGSISIGGRSVDRLAPHRRSVAMVSQDYALYPHLTVGGNLAFPLKMRQVPVAEIEARVRQAAEWLEIGELLDRRPDQLSGGQQQRVALGRAMVRRPDVSLLDEPLANLDARLRLDMRRMLVGLQRRLRLTMLHVTHDQAEAAAMADRIVVLNEGRVEQVGTPAQLWAAPSTRFVAGFFGWPPMNFLAGRLQAGAGGLEFASPTGLRVPLPLGASKGVDALLEPGPCTLGIRCQDIVLDHGGETTLCGTLGRVSSVERFDGSLLVRIAAGSDELTARCADRRDLVPGTAVSFSLLPERAYFFAGSDDGRLLRGPSESGRPPGADYEVDATL
ncbi:MAG: ABC transporter ATP-binding protein [Thermoguttaceae bacterium]